MARPVYIVCSEGGAEDKLTGLVSLFHLVDQLQVQRIPEKTQGPILVQSIPLRVTATWMMEKNDAGEEFEYENQIVLPHGEVFPTGKGIFVFEKAFQRFTIHLPSVGQLPFRESGTMRAESRIKKVGASRWLAQECPVIVELRDAPPPQPQSRQNDN